MYRSSSRRGQSLSRYSNVSRNRVNQKKRFSRRRPNTNQSRSIRGGQFSDITKFINKVIPTSEIKPYQPINSFADFPISEHIKKNIIKTGYSELTPIQDQSIPYILNGRDIVGIANTGTGKTAAFVIPLLDKVLKDKQQNVLELRLLKSGHHISCLSM